MSKNKLTVETKGHELILTRMFDAPRELVFETFTSCEHLNNWWGPREWPLSYCKIDFNEGGKWQYCMRGPDGQESWGLCVYKTITRPEEIVWTDHFTDKDGNINDELPGSVSTNEFIDVEGKTKLICRAIYPSEEDLKTVLEMGMIEGTSETFDRLEEHLEELARTGV